MKNTRAFLIVVVVCGGLFLSGCHQQEMGTGPIPAPHTAPSPQAQMQEIDNNPHIPDAQKAALKANIASHSGGAAPAPAATP